MWDFVDKVIYINLDHREDRRIIMTKFFKETNIPLEKVVRFSAFKHIKGEVGCTTSHTRALQLAKDNGWKNVLILEDDLEVINFEESYKKLEELVKLEKWDVIMLTGWYYKYDFPRIYFAGNTGAYLVNEKYIDILLQNRLGSIAGFEKLERSRKVLGFSKKTNEYNADVYWTSLQTKDLWYGINPCLCRQVDGFSDIGKKVIKSSVIVGPYDDKIHRTVYK